LFLNKQNKGCNTLPLFYSHQLIIVKDIDNKIAVIKNQSIGNIFVSDAFDD